MEESYKFMPIQFIQEFSEETRKIVFSVCESRYVHLLVAIMVKPQDIYKPDEIEIKVVCINNMFFVLYLLDDIS